MDTASFGFPFRIDKGGVASLTGDDNIRGKIIQVLFTSPGERVNMPEFGCGLMDLVFDSNNQILAATAEFTVRTSLERWLGDEILVEDVDVTSEEENLKIAIVYVRKDTLERQAMRINF